jgi:hypothetical protein
MAEDTNVYTLVDVESALNKKGLVKNKKEDKQAYSDIEKIYNLLTGKAVDVTKIKTPNTWKNFQMKIREITVHNKPIGAITLIVETFSKETDRGDWQKAVNASLIKIFDRKSISLSKPVSAGQSKSSQATKIELTTYITGGPQKKQVSEPIQIYLIFKDPVAKVVVNTAGELDITVTPAKMGVSGLWLTPQELAQKSKDYFSDIIYQGKKLPKEYIKEFHDIIDEALNLKLIIDYNVRQSKDMALFAEILSAIKLGVLLQNPTSTSAKTVIDAIKFNEPAQAQYMKVLKNSAKNDKIEIKLPNAQNYSLLDYFISYDGQEDKSVADGNTDLTPKEKLSLKISVKSKLSSTAKIGKEAKGETNTVKFDDMFDKLPKNVILWYNQFKATGLTQMAKEQFGPKVIAYKAITAKEIGAGGLYPIQALSYLLTSPTTSKNQTAEILPVLKRFGQKKTYFDKTLAELRDFKDKRSKGKYSENDVVEAYRKAFIELGYQDNIKKYNYRNPIRTLSGKIGEENVHIIENTIGHIMETFLIGPGDIETKIINLVILAERIVSESSTEESTAKYNFYKMFFDKVIKEKSIIYGVPTRFGPNKLILKYYGLNNWESKFTEYKKSLWIGLRGKASPNKPPDKWGGSLGISV